jgi:hypothetical protein
LLLVPGPLLVIRPAEPLIKPAPRSLQRHANRCDRLSPPIPLHCQQSLHFVTIHSTLPPSAASYGSHRLSTMC